MKPLIYLIVLLLSTNAVAQTYPPGAVAGGKYTVPRSESTLDIITLALPDNFTLSFAADVEAVKWTVKTFQYGQGATIDLTRTPRLKASTGARGANSGDQAGHGAKGKKGGNGGTGAAGRPGISLTIHATKLINTVGSLWIRTDGNDGGLGGVGGRGQTGGGSCCGGYGCGADTNAGPGGDGGTGGTGGAGGATSAVTITADNLPSGSVFQPTACDVKCTASTRPPLASGNSGIIMIWGAPGCGGGGGNGGDSGSGDKSVPSRVCYHGLTHRVVEGSGPGTRGGAGDGGPLGTCSAAVIKSTY